MIDTKVTKLISFGFRHGKAPDCPLVDVRPLFGRNPYHDKKLRKLRGDHPDVIIDIHKTPFFEANYEKLKKRVLKFDGVVGIGCTGGHHRSVYLANRLAKELGIEVEHRDYDKP
jgi:UPF0042 nucleotide-binding protein